ncbi:unnamed protein product [Calypogeia fissa]
MGVEVVEQMWSFITRAVDSRQFYSSRLFVDVHQTAISFGLSLLVLALVYYWFTLSPWSVKSSKSGLKVPPSNTWMLPLIGETIHLAINVDTYGASRVQRYGEMFSSHLFGVSAVVVTNVEAIKHVLASPNQKNFISMLPPSIRKHFGPESVNQIPASTPMHTNLRRLFYQRTKGENVSGLIATVDAVVKTTLNSWPERGTVKAYQELKKILHNVRVTINAAYEPSAVALTWLLKFLAENPDDLQEIIAEHRAIADSKGSKEYELTYQDTLRMPASTRAFLETNRVVIPNFGVIRTATKDEELHGKLIPKGWTLFLPFRPTHYDPKYYPDPYKFNPSRFKTIPPQPGIFLAFGSGPRICPGGDLAKTQALVFLHRLVLGYRWELLGRSDAMRTVPVPVPRGYLPIRVTRIEE